jgi:hypothetical protein
MPLDFGYSSVVFPPRDTLFAPRQGPSARGYYALRRMPRIDPLPFALAASKPSAYLGTPIVSGMFASIIGGTAIALKTLIVP